MQVTSISLKPQALARYQKRFPLQPRFNALLLDLSYKISK